MSLPGFTGGGAPEIFAGAPGLPGRSNNTATATTNNTTTATTINRLHLSHPLYRTQQQLPAIFLDPSSHTLQRQTSSLIGKRTLAEFQTQQSHNHNHNHNQVLSNFLFRSVKPRTFQVNSPISPLSPVDFSMSPESPNSSGFQTQRFGNLPLLQQLRPQPINLPNGSLPMPNSLLQNTNHPYPISNSGQVQNRAVAQVLDKKIMQHRLQELEKQLLEDNEEEEGDAISVITNTEFSDAIQNLISSVQSEKPISASPTSSTTSSISSSSSVASPASNCSKQSLMDAASAISERKLDVASEILSRLAQNPNGNSDQRLMDCMVSALKSRMNPVENPPPVVELFSKEHAESTQFLFENSPCFKIAFRAANLAILEAILDEKTENGNKFCVVDFDIGHGRQYMSLLHALSSTLKGKPATVKISAVVENGSEDMVKTVGELLSQQAEQLGIRLEFKVVTPKLGELTRESLGCEPNEPLAVNFAFKLYRMPDESVSTENPRDGLLRRVKGLAPRVVTLVEQELNTNTAPIMARVAESYSYYRALLDSIESTTARGNSDRVKVEEALSRKLCNSIACEGRDRLERCEVFGKWRARMSMAGFQLKSVSHSVTESIKMRLGPGNRVNVIEESGGVCFSWMGKTLTVASAWR